MTKTLFCIVLFILIVVVCEIAYRNKQKNRIKDCEDDQRYINNDRKIGW